jgi:hypothetical protein
MSLLNEIADLYDLQQRTEEQITAVNTLIDSLTFDTDRPNVIQNVRKRLGLTPNRETLVKLLTSYYEIQQLINDTVDLEPGVNKERGKYRARLSLYGLASKERVELGLFDTAAEANAAIGAARRVKNVFNNESKSGEETVLDSTKEEKIVLPSTKEEKTVEVTVPLVENKEEDTEEGSQNILDLSQAKFNSETGSFEINGTQLDFSIL